MAIIGTFRNSKQEQFLAESLLVCTDSDLNVCVPARWQISSHVHSLQDEADAANGAVFSFHGQEVRKTNR